VNREHVAFKAALMGVMAYEAVAITTGRVPTISSLCRKHRSVEIALAAILLGHLHHRLGGG
jgi:hypothetical protein